MEKNISYLSSQVKALSVKMAWGQLDVIADDTEAVQVLVAGEDQPVQDLRIALELDRLVIEQPQLGISMSVLSRKWLQVCIRVPLAWRGNVDLSTITGMLCVGRLQGDAVRMDTITGALLVNKLRGDTVSLRTVSGGLSGDSVEAGSLSLRSVSGEVSASRLRCARTRAWSLAGAVNLHFEDAFDTLDMQTVSGAMTVVQQARAVRLVWKAPRGKQVLAQSVTVGDTGPLITAGTLSGKLTLMHVDEAQGGDEDGQRWFPRDAGRQYAAVDAPSAEDAAADGSDAGDAGREGV